MDKAQVEQRVKKGIASTLGIVNINEIVPEARLIEDLAADSLDVIELGMAGEEEFEIDIPHEDLEGIVTVQDAVDYITEKVGAA